MASDEKFSGDSQLHQPLFMEQFEIGPDMLDLCRLMRPMEQTPLCTAFGAVSALKHRWWRAPSAVNLCETL